MSALAIGPRYSLDPDLPFRVLDGQAVIIDSRSRQVHLFNETGTRIWTLLQAPCSASAIAQSLAEEYTAEPEEILPEVLRFMESLVLMKLVVAHTEG